MSEGLEAIGAFELQAAERIYHYAPVFKVRHPACSDALVLKKTRSPLSAAHAIQRWLKALNQHHGRPCCVEAVPELAPNPRQCGEDCWVVYPFLRGQDYAARPAQLQAAGHLLGSMHSLARSFGLPQYDWPLQDAGSLEEDRQGLLELQARLKIPISEAVFKWLSEHLEIRAQLKASYLPAATSCWDYKANNLIFHPDGPLLIDPDSGGFLPRILDLALAVILFHNDLAQAPPRLFNAEEWRAFLRGYTQQVVITEEEQELWPLALKWMLLEEGLWLILNDTEGWENPHQARYLQDLLCLPQYGHLFALSPDAI